MSAVHAEPEVLRRADALTRPSPLLAFALVAATLLGVFAVFAPTVLSMARIWARSETFNHCFLVVPASLWMIWRTRHELAAVEARPFWPGLLGVAAAGWVWLVGELASAAALSHLAVIGVAVATVVTVFGWRWARVMAFPLAFLFFAAPFGEAFVPQLIEWTADFTVLALQLSGVPVWREGNDLFIPTGRWSVVEACSGVRYLIASLVTGSLYAWLMYRSPLRRTAFIAASIAVPILANWLRAYLIVMLGHLSDNAIATGVDHLIYGWVFFGVVMLVMFAAGLRWREDDAPPARVRAEAASWSPARLVPGFVGAAALVIAAPAAAALLAAHGDARPVQLQAPQPDGPWRALAAPADDWSPVLAGARSSAALRFADGSRNVTLHLGMFRDQREGSELVSSAHLLVPDKASPWVVVSRGTTVARLDGRDVTVRAAVLRRGLEYRQVWQWYWLDGGRSTASDGRAKLALAFDRLRLRSDTSAWVAIATAHDPDHPQRSATTLRDFLAAMDPAVQAALHATAQR